MHDCYPISITRGEITLRIAPSLPRDFGQQIGQLLSEWTGENWKVVLSEEQGSPSLHEQAQARKKQQLEQVEKHPLVESVLGQFPGAKLVSVN